MLCRCRSRGGSSTFPPNVELPGRRLFETARRTAVAQESETHPDRREIVELSRRCKLDGLLVTESCAAASTPWRSATTFRCRDAFVEQLVGEVETCVKSPTHEVTAGAAAVGEIGEVDLARPDLPVDARLYFQLWRLAAVLAFPPEWIHPRTIPRGLPALAAAERRRRFRERLPCCLSSVDRIDHRP
jgi:hypothetical protein